MTHSRQVLGSAELLLVDAARRHAGNAALHRAGPVHPLRLRSGEVGWLVVGHEAARAALVDLRLQGRTATVGHGRPMRERLRRGMNSHMLNAGPPDHSRLRALVSGAFTRRRMEAMRPRIEAMTADLLDRLDTAIGPTDLVAGLALPLPLQVLTELFGVPRDDIPAFHGWTSTLTASGLSMDQVHDAAAALLGYVRELLEDKRRRPCPDLLTALVEARDGTDRLSDDELTSMVFLLLTAGYETTVNLVANGLLALLAQPARAARVRADPASLPAVVEETLRYDSPVQITLRYSTEPLELAGTPIPAGATVLVSLLAANRDPARFADPAEFDPGRSDRAHLGFGYGFHYCIGAPLARIEAVTALGAALERFPRLRLAVPAAELAWRPSMIMHGPAALPVLLA